ncbi:MAG: hypothetical protein EOM50_24565, partial [Erysipelotrichia bacterium]|nr:hypothetical protein [Erysipelotrichia bacterium]
MAKKNKGKDKKSNKELRNKISYYLIMLRKQRLTLEEFEFYCSELDLTYCSMKAKTKSIGKCFTRHGQVGR